MEGRDYHLGGVDPLLEVKKSVPVLETQSFLTPSSPGFLSPMPFSLLIHAHFPVSPRSHPLSPNSLYSRSPNLPVVCPLLHPLSTVLMFS